MADLVIKLQKQKDGVGVVIDILRMRFHRMREKEVQYSIKLIEAACTFLEEYPFTRDFSGQHNIGYSLAEIAKVCFSSKFGVKFILSICERFAKLTADYSIYPFEYIDLFSTIARSNPLMFLDVFLENKKY